MISKEKRLSRKPALKSPEIIVVGAGAVGLMVGNLLGQRNIPALIPEKAEKPRAGSRAIGITPPSLDLLATLNLDKKFKQHGVAAWRAAQLMRLGALKGRLLSGVRNPLIRLVVGLIPRTLAGYFSMLSIPYRSLAQVLAKEPLLFK